MFALILLCLGFCLLYMLTRIQKPKNFPPGPRPLPILGNLLHLSLDNPMKDFEKMAKRFGSVYSLYIGSRPAVVLNGFEAMKEALLTKSTDFAGRPQDMMVNRITRGKGVILVDYGSSWKEHRRFALMTLRNFGMGKNSMEERIHGEIQHIIDSLEKSVGTTMNPQVMFHNAASNIICLILFGNRYEYNDEFLVTFVRLFTENAKMTNGPWSMIYDSFPMLRNLPLPFQKAFRNAELAQKMALKLVEQHKETRVPGEPRDFMDCYLEEMTKRDEDSSFNEDQMMMYVLDLHFAGTDTTSNTLLTAFLYLVAFPNIQERCQQEIDQFLEGKARVSFEDRHQMHYMHAFAHEAQRIASTVPLSVFHSTTKDTSVAGYSIPKGTLIIPNLTSVLYEEGYWKFPNEFNPENFLNDQGEFHKPEAFLPFSLGPRMCLGEGLARMELFLILVTLLRRFQFVWPEEAGEPDFTPVFGVTLSPKPYRMGIQRRGTRQGGNI